jgi:hypothetical protein
MAQNYTRQSSFADGDTITASLFNNEYNQLVNAFSYSSTDVDATGHRHDGTSGEGGNIYRIGDLNFLNKIEADSVNNRWGFFVEVSSTAVEQIRIQDGVILPVITNDIDLGSATFQFKDLYLDGTANIDSLVLSSGSTVTAILDEDNLVSDSSTALATQQSIKAYVDAQVTAQDLDFQGDTGGALNIDLDSETLTIAGGTGIDTAGATNTLTVSIDSTVATLTGTQTLTNKTIDADNNTVSNLEVDNLKTGVLDTDISSVAGTHTTLPSALAVKTYVDAQVTAQDLDIFGDTGTDAIDLDSETLTFTGGTGITSVVTAGTVTHNIDSTVATLTGTQTLTNKTLTSPTISGNLTTDGNIDGRDVAADGTKLDGIEALADVTDTANVTAAGALMDSELTNITAIKALNQGVATTDSPSFAGLTATTADINAGTIDGTVIGGSTAAAGTFTTGQFNTSLNVDGTVTADGLTVDGTAIVSDSTASVLRLLNTGTTGDGLIHFGDSASNFSGVIQYNHDADYMALFTDTQERMRIDSSGNVGIGVVPSSWASNTFDALQLGVGIGVGNLTARVDGINAVGFGLNWYYGGGATNTYVASSYATNYVQEAGTHKWLHAASGTAGAALTFTESMRIDSSGNVGIGTSSPNAVADLHVADTSDARIWLDATSADTMELYSGTGVGMFNRSNSYLMLGTNNTERMRIDSSGNLGLGVAPSAWSQGRAFELLAPGMGLWNGSGSPSSIYMTSNAYFNGGFKYGGNGEASHYYQYLGQHVWSTATSGTAGNAISFTQAMTLDTSGNLLVGKTATGFGTAGIEARSGGTLWATASGTNAASFNRLTNDGDIAIFAKDGAPVGSIGVRYSNLYAGRGTSGLAFSATGLDVHPFNPSTLDDSDAAIDLGFQGTLQRPLPIRRCIPRRYWCG